MRGEILGFDRDSHTGAISGHDGRRYEFVRLEWRGPGEPSRGEAVDFVPDDPRAIQVYPLGSRLGAETADTAQLVYILYLASLIVPITCIVGVVMAYVNRDDAPDWLRTHYRFQIRTFWLALLYAVIGAVTVVALIGLVILVFALIWWIVRCIKGLQQLSRGLPYPNPESWAW